MLGKIAAEIDAVDLDGKPVTLADYRGKVTVLAFWSSKRGSEYSARNASEQNPGTIQWPTRGDPGTARRVAEFTCKPQESPGADPRTVRWGDPDPIPSRPFADW